MSSRIKELVSIIVALMLVAVMQYFASRHWCDPYPHDRTAQRHAVRQHN